MKDPAQPMSYGQLYEKYVDLQCQVGALKRLLPDPNILHAVANDLVARGITPAFNADHLRAKADAIRGARAAMDAQDAAQ